MKNRILITGTSKGIGKYLAEYYLSNDAVVIGCSRSISTIEHQNYLHFQLDINDEIQVKHFCLEIINLYNGIDVLINNAGIASMNLFLLTPMNMVEKIFRTNFFSTFLFCREISKIMKKNHFGRIVNFSTVAVPLNLEGESIYAASKSAVETLTKILAKELATFGITCNAIGPSPIQTDLIKNVNDQILQKLIEKQAIKEFGEMSDISNVIDFFISPKSNKITGQIIYLSGVC